MTVELGTGSVLGRYELLMPVAKGGMAQVWLARLHGSRGFNKLVAVKTLLPTELPETRSQAMLLEEAHLAASVHHPNVVTTLDLGEENGLPYLVMEWVHGESLREVYRRAIESGGIPWRVGVSILAQACKGLHAAHEARSPSGAPLHMVHRDISPQNLLISYSGLVKVADFGIAKAKLGAVELTQPGEVKGKASFMSPEQLGCQPLDCRSDVFAMGTLLYLVTTGHHPFRGTTMSKTLNNICDCDPPRPSAVNRHFPSDLEQVIIKALDKDRDKRWQSAAELFEALAATEDGCLIGQGETPIAEYMRRLMGDRELERSETLRRLLDVAPTPSSQRPASTPGRTTLEAQPSSLAAPEPPSLDPHVIGDAHGETDGEERPSNTTLVSQIRQTRRRRWIAAVTVVGALALGLVAGMDLSLRDSEPHISGTNPTSAVSPATNTRTSLPSTMFLARREAAQSARSSNTAAESLAPPTPARSEAPDAASAKSSPSTASPEEFRTPDELPSLPNAGRRTTSVRRESGSGDADSVVVSRKAEVSAAPTVDAWDRSLFGGRN